MEFAIWQQWLFKKEKRWEFGLLLKQLINQLKRNHSEEKENEQTNRGSNDTNDCTYIFPLIYFLCFWTQQKNSLNPRDWFCPYLVRTSIVFYHVPGGCECNTLNVLAGLTYSTMFLNWSMFLCRPRVSDVRQNPIKCVRRNLKILKSNKKKREKKENWNRSVCNHPASATPFLTFSSRYSVCCHCCFSRSFVSISVSMRAVHSFLNLSVRKTNAGLVSSIVVSFFISAFFYDRKSLDSTHLRVD